MQKREEDHPFRMDEQFRQSTQQYKQQEYQALINRLKPRPTYTRNAFWAFTVGGAISVTGQALISLFKTGGMDPNEAGTATVILMVFLGALLTGLGVYDNLGKLAGAGSIVPITGFANSITSPAMEFKREGFVYGVGARMFTVAGPVLVYGFATSVMIGLVKFLFR